MLEEYIQDSLPHSHKRLPRLSQTIQDEPLDPDFDMHSQQRPRKLCLPQRGNIRSGYQSLSMVMNTF